MADWEVRDLYVVGLCEPEKQLHLLSVLRTSSGTEGITGVSKMLNQAGMDCCVGASHNLQDKSVPRMREWPLWELQQRQNTGLVSFLSLLNHQLSIHLTAMNRYLSFSNCQEFMFLRVHGSVTVFSPNIFGQYNKYNNSYSLQNKCWGCNMKLDFLPEVSCHFNFSTILFFPQEKIPTSYIVWTLFVLFLQHEIFSKQFLTTEFIFGMSLDSLELHQEQICLWKPNNGSKIYN